MTLGERHTIRLAFAGMAHQHVTYIFDELPDQPAPLCTSLKELSAIRDATNDVPVRVVLPAPS